MIEPMTATGARSRDNRDGYRRQMMQDRFDYFIRRWQPHEPRDAAQFNAELHSLVREVYMDMQTPITQVVEAVLARTLPGPIFVKTKDMNIGER